MKEWVKKLIDSERKISRQKGGFTLFALFLREGAIGKWDLVVAAPWIDDDPRTALYYLTKEVEKALNQEEILDFISRVVLIYQDSPALEIINQEINVEHDYIEKQGINLYDLDIKHAYIITSKKENANVEVLTV